MGKKINVVITGSWTSLNKGDAGIMVTLIQSLKSIIPSVNITIVAKDPEKDALRYREKCVGAPISAPKSSLNTKNRYAKAIARRVVNLLDMLYVLFKLACYFIASLIARVLTRCTLPRIFLGSGFDAFQAFCNADVIFGVGGGYLSHISGVRGFTFHAIQLVIPKLLRKPVLLCPCSIGPYHKDLLGILSKLVLDKIDCIVLREAQSYEYISSMGVTLPRLEVTVDLAFGLVPVKRCEALDLLKRQAPVFHQHCQLLVGMTANDWPFPELRQDERTERQETYFQSVVSICNYIIEVLHGTVCFLPQNIECQPRRNVIVAATKIRSMVRMPERVCVIENEQTPEELKGLYGLMDICVVSHMHGLIYSVSQFTPALAFTYEPKFYGMLKMLEMEDLAVDRYLATPETAMTKFDYLLKNREKIQRKLEVRMDYISSLYENNVGIIKDFLIAHVSGK